MRKVLGLYSHVRRNIGISRLIVVGFVVATCVCWILCLISYNVGFRQFVGEDFHREMVHGSQFIACSKGISACQKQHQPTGVEFVTIGAQTALQTMYIPVLGVLAWLALVWFKNGKLVSWATGAAPAWRSNEKRLYNIVESLAIQTGRPVPQLQIVESEALNAFACGVTVDDSMIGVTRGLLNKLSDRELEAVIAHEYTHILNGDSRVMVLAAVFVGIFENWFHYFLSGITGAHEKHKGSPFANQFVRLFIGAIVFAPLCASFAICWIPSLLGRARLSRTREFLADAGAVELTKDADALVSALLRIEQCNTHLAVSRAISALMIAGSTTDLFATHPPIDERIAALRAYAGARATVMRGTTNVGRLANLGETRVAFGRRDQSQRTDDAHSDPKFTQHDSLLQN